MSADVIAMLEMLKRSYEVGRDCHSQEDAENDRHVRGLRAGLQIAIDGIEAELRLLREPANAGRQP